jgi:alpha-L-fucosidase
MVACMLALAVGSAYCNDSRAQDAAPATAPAARGGGADGGGAGMGPPSRAELVAKAAAETPAIPPGPFQPTWDSIRENYQVPQWFRDGKFGIMMHWGLYSVAAYHNEWYVKYIYGNAGIRNWHIKNFGSLDEHGYITLADKFATKFDPEQWADLFKKSGAMYIMPTAEHHDWFSLWDSQANRWNAARIGPKRDLIGELAKAVRAKGLKFGVSNHSIEHYTFINQRPPADMKSDLDDPRYADFYWVDHSDQKLEEFLKLWVIKNYELIDKYQPDMLWFDNGINGRQYDPIKLKVAAYYYNRAKQWGKEVSISTKSEAYLAGSIMDYERQGRAPKQLTDYVWQPDDPIGPTFGYTTANRGEDRTADMSVGRPGSYVALIVQNVSRNGNYLLNISPRGDGTIPENQQQVLLEIGKWLGTNGEAIYGTRPWTRSEEGSIHFTTKGDTLYAIALRWPADGTAEITSLPKSVGTVAKVELLGNPGTLDFTQDDQGLKIKMPAQQVGQYAFAMKITGLKLKGS